MRSNDRTWLKRKLTILGRTSDVGFEMQMPPEGDMVYVPGAAAAMARLVYWRCAELGLFKDLGDEHPVMDALFAQREPKTSPDGTIGWVADIENPGTSDEFKVILTELDMGQGQRRPYGIWFAGNYPRTFDALAKTLSLDMRVMDPSWVGMKLRKLLDYGEARGDFLARVPGQDRQKNYPSTVAYVADLVLHRYATLGVLDREGFSPQVRETQQEAETQVQESPGTSSIIPGKLCGECGSHAVIRKDGCDFCTACGAVGSCG
jgi:ribonucleoside-diphosphate reductase alpha chain